ncbi:MAG: N-acetylmuramoyl-L-alanine amidase, partial [Bacteroidota bacterium]|nr:N-acetylmuramoyl-L-alanine amidase [Bacteroidota bacterium]
MKHDGILKDIKQIDFPETDYYREKVEKKQICLHHTVSGGSAQAVANYWKSLSNRIATCMIIEKDGTPYQLFGSHYHAGHVGNVKGECEIFKLPFRSPSKNSFGIELINWGALTKRNDNLYTAYGKEFKGEHVEYSCSYRNYRF